MHKKLLTLKEWMFKEAMTNDENGDGYIDFGAGDSTDNTSSANALGAPLEAGKQQVDASRLSSQYMATKDLPDAFKPALRSIGYNKKDIEVVSSRGYSLSGASGDGSKSMVVAVNLGTGEFKVESGSWGGANMFVSNQVDLDDEVRLVPFNFAVIKGIGNGQTVRWAYIIVNPDNLQQLLPAKSSSVEFSLEEKIALCIIKGIKSSYRKDEFMRMSYDHKGLGRYDASNPVIKKLADNGLIKIGGAGISVTTDGKNLAEQFVKELAKQRIFL